MSTKAFDFSTIKLKKGRVVLGNDVFLGIFLANNFKFLLIYLKINKLIKLKRVASHMYIHGL